MTTTKIGSAFDLPAKSYELVKKNWKMFLLLNALSVASGLAVLFKDGSTEVNSSTQFFQNSTMFGAPAGSELGMMLGLGAIAIIFVIALAIFLSAMNTALELKASKGKQPSLNELIDDGKKYWLPLFLLTLLSGLIVLIGLILLIVPGIIAFSRVVMAPYLLVDKNLGVIESIKASNELTKKNQGPVWAAIGVYLLVVIFAGIISSIPRIGELISVVITVSFSLIFALRYLQLTKSSAKKSATA